MHGIHHLICKSTSGLQNGGGGDKYQANTLVIQICLWSVLFTSSPFISQNSNSLFKNSLLEPFYLSLCIRSFANKGAPSIKDHG